MSLTFKTHLAIECACPAAKYILEPTVGQSDFLYHSQAEYEYLVNGTMPFVIWQDERTQPTWSELETAFANSAEALFGTEDAKAPLTRQALNDWRQDNGIAEANEAITALEGTGETIGQLQAAAAAVTVASQYDSGNAAVDADVNVTNNLDTTPYSSLSAPASVSILGNDVLLDSSAVTALVNRVNALSVQCVAIAEAVNEIGTAYEALATAVNANAGKQNELAADLNALNTSVANLKNAIDG